MSRTHEILYFVGQRLLWGVQGGGLVFCLMQMTGSRAASATAPAPVTVQAPDVHVHLAPAAAPAPAGPPAPVDRAAEAERARLTCASVGLADGLYADRFRGITYIDRAMVDRLLEQQAVLMRSTRIVPELRDGRTVGVRLFGVRPDTMLGRLGFENGDVLRAINGIDVSSPERALEGYVKLRTSSELLVLVERQGAPRLLEFRIC